MENTVTTPALLSPSSERGACDAIRTQAPTPHSESAPKVVAPKIDTGRACLAGIARRHVRLLGHSGQLQKTTALCAAYEFERTSTQWCLFLTGTRGVGKTLAAEWLVCRLLSADPYRCIRLPFLFTPLALLPALEDPNLMKHLLQAPILAIDDLGVEPWDRGRRFAALLFEVVNARWRGGRRTVFTTNLSPPSLRGRYSASLGERLSQDSTWVVCLSPTLREAQQ